MGSVAKGVVARGTFRMVLQTNASKSTLNLLARSILCKCIVHADMCHSKWSHVEVNSAHKVNITKCRRGDWAQNEL